MGFYYPACNRETQSIYFVVVTFPAAEEWLKNGFQFIWRYAASIIDHNNAPLFGERVFFHR